ncbi:dethiobiotin synthase [Corynebacterium sp. H78]|uniref:dethiobiotin synthase n=1 Tax=Corynebacterium sp. H78 TaxID=3133417 RepID=UPI0030B63F0C
MSIVIVTGTGTDIGKTIATATLAVAVEAAGLEAVVVKPAQTGFPGGRGGDADTVTELTGITNTHGFARYPEPMAPVAAAKRAGMPLLDVADTAGRIVALDGPGRVVLVEGAGGLLVRLGDDWALPELSEQLPGAHTVVVTSMNLGSLNTAELTVEVARSRGMNVVGLVGGSVPERLAGIAESDLASATERDDTDAITDVDEAIVATNLRDMSQLTGVPFLAKVAEGAGALSQSSFVAAAPGWMTATGRQWLAELG